MVIKLIEQRTAKYQKFCVESQNAYQFAFAVKVICVSTEMKKHTGQKIDMLVIS